MKTLLHIPSCMQAWIGCIATLLWLLPPPAQGQNLADFERRTTVFTLRNGLTFIVLERPRTPTVACLTYADVGSVDDERGRTGLAHLLEHLAFKGTTTIGTRDYEAEKVLLGRLDDLYEAIRVERNRLDRDQERLRRLEAAFLDTQEEAAQCLVPDELSEAFKRAGGRGHNATTSFDYTLYSVNLPANKVELWMSIESDRLLNPVFREFHREKDVVMGERRLRIDNNPMERFLEEFRAICYRAHPYGTHIVGHMSDIESLTRPAAVRFFERFYGPRSLTSVIVGDVKADDIRKLAEVYFERIPGRPRPWPLPTIEPRQLGERRVVLEDAVRLAVIVGYHVGSRRHPDKAVLDVIVDMLGLGRTSRLYASLVKDKGIATNVSGQVLTGKCPGLIVFFAFPASGYTPSDCLQAIDEQIDRLKTEPATDEELHKARMRATAGLVRSLQSNSGLARELAYYHVVTGDWRNLFRHLDAIRRVTARDVQRVVGDVFHPRNRSIGFHEAVSRSQTISEADR